MDIYNINLLPYENIGLFLTLYFICTMIYYILSLHLIISKSNNDCNPLDILYDNSNLEKCNFFKIKSTANKIKNKYTGMDQEYDDRLKILEDNNKTIINTFDSKVSNLISNLNGKNYKTNDDINDAILELRNIIDEIEEYIK